MKSAVITKKTFYCPVCKNEEDIETNHYGEIYPKCKKCDNGGMYLKGEYGHKFTRDYRLNIVPYKFNLGIVSHRRMYNILKEHLIEDLHYKIFDTHAPEFGKSAFHEASWNKASHMNVGIKLPNQFKTQFVTEIGRLHNWFQYIFPNKDIITGYYLIHPHNKSEAE